MTVLNVAWMIVCLLFPTFDKNYNAYFILRFVQASSKGVFATDPFSLSQFPLKKKKVYII